MSIDFSGWLGNSNNLSSVPSDTAAQRAVRAWRRINDKPSTVAFKPKTGATLAAQTVRIESDNRATEAESAAGKVPVRKLIIFGVRNHPDVTVADTDMKEGYRFVSGTDEYTVIDTIETLGEVQGIAEATG
jgi:hypothetical protein